MILPDVGARYWNRRTQRQMTVVEARGGNVLLMDRAGREWLGSLADFWETWLHRDAVRARSARWRQKTKNIDKQVAS